MPVPWASITCGMTLAVFKQIGELTIEHQLRRAVSRGEFELFYQPKVDVVSHKLEGLEALMRWRRPNGHLVSPGVFVPVLESSGMIVEVGKWLIHQAVKDCTGWLQQGLTGLSVAMNVTPSQLRNDAFVSEFLSAAAQ